MSSKNCLLMVRHGSGLEFATISLARDLAKEYKSLYISSANTYFAECLERENGNIHAISNNELVSLFSTVMRDKKNWDVFDNEVYQTSKFFLRDDNIYDALREHWNMKRLNDWTKDGSSYTPYLSVIPDIIKRQVFEFTKQHPKLVMLQRKGGINPVVPHNERLRAVQAPERGLVRSYPLKESEEVVKLLVSKGYEVLQYCLPEEERVKGCLYMQQEQSQLFYYELSKHAAGIITIDSSLLHLSIHNNDNVVCIWEQSASGDRDCRGFGYKKAKNLYCKVDTSVPYFNGVPASPYIEYVAPEDIVEAFEHKASQS